MGERASARLLSATAEIATRGPAHQLKKEVQARTTLPFAPSSGDGLRSLYSLNQSGAGASSACKAAVARPGHSPLLMNAALNGAQQRRRDKAAEALSFSHRRQYACQRLRSARKASRLARAVIFILVARHACVALSKPGRAQARPQHDSPSALALSAE